MNLKKFGWILAASMFFAVPAAAQEEAPAAPAAPEAPAAAPAPVKAEGQVSVKDLDDLAGATAVLEQCDKNHNYFTKQYIKTDMVLNGGVHHDVTYSFKTYTEGNKRAVRFFAPAEMRGMGVVTRGRNEVHVRLPDASNVRRVASHAKRQSFYGSDWSMDDMSMIYYGQDYDVVKVLNLDDNNHYVFELKLKKDVDLPYPKLVIKIEKSRLLMDYIEYYDDTLKLLKIQERMELKDLGSGHQIYSHIKLTDVTTKHVTENFVSVEYIDDNIPKSEKITKKTFTESWLKTGL